MSAIQIFGRIRPTRKPCKHFVPDFESSRVEFNIPKELKGGLVNNTKEEYKFTFSKIFDPLVTQQEVFESLGMPMVKNAFEGYNGTIFAYGQTGSGKTFSITGGAERYEDRGLIPRTLQYLFEETKKKPDVDFLVRISYLEIYNDSGYDLLDPNHDSKKLEDLPKVTMQSDDDGNTRMNNIRMVPVGSMEDALNLLFIGDTNRVICETPMNDSSSRSHCIFSIYLEGKRSGSATIRSSKLHLVDLAGSERVKKSNIDGKIMTEAKAINLSLHYLEQVIVALYEKSQGKRSHIPYRNSMMTAVLRDSLGGNCKTSMLATLSAEKDFLDESISTCRFAQRVAKIKNEAVINENQDPSLVILQLKQEVAELRDQLAAARGDDVSEKVLTDEEKLRCGQLVSEYGRSNDPHAVLKVHHPSKVQCCFAYFKQWLLQQHHEQMGDSSVLSSLPLTLNQAGPGTPGQNGAANGGRGPRQQELAGKKGGGGGGMQAQHIFPAPPPAPFEAEAALHEDIKKLHAMVHARDEEISLLVGMLQQAMQKGQIDSTVAPAYATSGTMNGAGKVVDKEAVTRKGLVKIAGSDAEKQALSEQLLAERNQAFKEFSEQYKKTDKIDEQKEQLRVHFAEAKALGEAVNHSRSKINSYKALVEQRRISAGAQQMSGGGGGVEGADGAQSGDAEEAKLLALIDKEKEVYREQFQQLKQYKGEIERIQALIERSRRTMQKDFDAFWQQRQQAGSRGGGGGGEELSLPPIHNNQTNQYGAQLAVLDSQQQQRGSGGGARGGGLPSKPALLVRPSSSSSSASSSSITSNTSNRASNPSYPNPSYTPPLTAQSQSSNSSQLSGVSISTGNQQADADIAAFYKARDDMLARARGL